MPFDRDCSILGRLQEFHDVFIEQETCVHRFRPETPKEFVSQSSSGDDRQNKLPVSIKNSKAPFVESEPKGVVRCIPLIPGNDYGKDGNCCREELDHQHLITGCPNFRPDRRAETRPNAIENVLLGYLTLDHSPRNPLMIQFGASGKNRTSDQGLMSPLLYR